MQGDPRRHNEYFDASSVSAYAAAYANRLKLAIEAVDAAELSKAFGAIETAAANNRRVYSAGNGGSAAIADHLCCDWTKGTHVDEHPTLRSYSLNSNVSLYSAVANDFGFERVFSTQVEFFGERGDVLIAISSSGNSANILNAVGVAKKRGLTTIGLSGFAGGELRAISDISLYVPVMNYGIVEDAHQALVHIIAQYMAIKRE